MSANNQISVPDPGSLQNLHDIVVPEPAGWWPPAPGWYVLAAMLLIALILILARTVLSYKANRYRRDGQKQLARLRKLSQEPGRQADAISQANQLLKRVALAGWSRQRVAVLSGNRWLTFLNETGGDTLISEEQARVLLDVLYCREICERLSPTEVEELFDAADRWVRTHDRSLSVADTAEEDVEC